MGSGRFSQAGRQFRQIASRLAHYGAFLFVASCLTSAYGADDPTTPGIPNTTTAERLVHESIAAAADGDAARQFALLRQAVRIEPDNPLAHWHLGQMNVDGEWIAVEEAQRRAAADPKQAEYREFRAEYGETPQGQLALARWCRKNELEDEAKFHWAAVLSLQPNNEEALGAVGRRWYSGRLLTPDEIAQARDDAKAAQRAIRPWVVKRAIWQRAVSGKRGMTRETALDEIRALRSVEAIPTIEEVTLSSDSSKGDTAEHQRDISMALIAALSEMPEQAATISLVRHSVLPSRSDVRSAATYALSTRPMHDYVPLLLSQLSSPIESSFSLSTGADGSVQYLHSLYREGQDANWSKQLRRGVYHYDLDSPALLTRMRLGKTFYRRRSESRAVVAQKIAAVTARSQSQFGSEAIQIEHAVAATNAMSDELNARITAVLANSTDQDFDADPRQWWGWWNDYNEYYADGEPPVYEQYYNDTDVYYHSPPIHQTIPSCFVKGTLVWTKIGERPIESLELGELVLSQDPNTGRLAYKPIMGRTTRPPSPILVLKFDNDEIGATLGHPLWVAGIGWRMAKQLEDGALLHAVTGALPVAGIEKAEDAEAYNLIVADFNTYFVGEQGVLVHDNTPRKPTRATVPGLVRN